MEGLDMKKRWNVRRLIPLPILLGLILACGAVFAYMFLRTAAGEAQFKPAQVSCSAAETVEGNSKTGITVQNTGNISAYLRVRLVTYWVNDDGKVAAKSSPTLTVDYDDDNWIAGSENTFYYKQAVAPNGAKTLNLLKSPITLTSEDGFKQVVDVFAEAIQAKPAAAAEDDDSWDVTIVNGEITAAP